MSAFLQGFTALLLFQCAGEGLSRLFGLPVPGPVIGMVLLFAWLRLVPAGAAALATAAEGLARHLSLLFVPAGVGVMLYLGTLAQEWRPIAASLVLGTGLTLATVAWTFAALLRWQAAREAARAGEPP
jgi:holin-like protein